MSGEAVRRGQAHWRLAWLYFAAVMLAYAVVIFTAKMPPAFVDYPDWVYQGVLFQRVLTGHPLAVYALKGYPVPNSLTTIGLGLSDIVLSWNQAAKLWVCLYFVLAGIATWTLVRTLRVASPMLLVALPGLVFLNLDFWWGHVGFEMGMCLVMIFIALLLRGVRPLTLSVLLIVIFFMHMEACACALLFLALWVGHTGKWRSLWVAAPTVLLTAWYGIARFSGKNANAGALLKANYPYGSKSFFVYKANTFFKTFGYVNARTMDGLSQSERIFGRDLLLLLVVISLAAAVLSLLAIARAAFAGRDSDRRYLSWFVLALAGVALFLPQILLGTADPGSRILLVAVVTGFFMMDWRRPAATIVAVLSAVLCLANLCQFGRIDHAPDSAGHAKDLPTAILTYAHVEPATRLGYYTHLQNGDMNLNIFSTALFVRKPQ